MTMTAPEITGHTQTQINFAHNSLSFSLPHPGSDGYDSYVEAVWVRAAERLQRIIQMSVEHFGRIDFKSDVPPFHFVFDALDFIGRHLEGAGQDYDTADQIFDELYGFRLWLMSEVTTITQRQLGL